MKPVEYVCSQADIHTYATTWSLVGLECVTVLATAGEGGTATAPSLARRHDTGVGRQQGFDR